MKKLISIVTPIYNETNNIQQYLDTLFKQTSQSFHVILIDDGSTDNSVELIKELLGRNKQNFSFSYEILSQKNSGAAKAREVGIKHASTDYILILDCDDAISEDMIYKTEQCILDHPSDIYFPNVQIQLADNSYHAFKFYDERQTYTGLEALEYSLVHWQVHGSTCVKRTIFLKSYYQYSQYNPHHNNYINNDEVITRLNFMNAEYTQKYDGVYFYQNNENSTTKKINNQRFLICQNAIFMYELFGKDMGHISIKAQQELINTFWGTLRYYRKNISHISNSEDWVNEFHKTLCFLKKNRKNMKLSWKSKTRLIRANYLLKKLKSISP